MASLTAALKSILNGTKSPAPTTSEFKTSMGTVYDFITDLLGTDSSIAANASRCLGLVGAPNAGMPLTKFDLSASAVVLRNASSNTVARYNTGTITCDLGLAGITANGRDQASAFTANSWLYLYFIWNGTTLASISSLALPTVGPTLPTGYTHWAYATSLRWNGSSNIVPCYARGATVLYDVVTGGSTRALSSGTATTMTGVSLAQIVPPNVLTTDLYFELDLIHTSASGFTASVRPTGAANAGINVIRGVTVGSGISMTLENTFSLPPGAGQGIDYKLNQAPGTSGGLYISVLSFTIPNGDA